METIMNTINQVTPKSAGALTFSPDGVLFLGDSKLGAVFAFETERWIPSSSSRSTRRSPERWA
jgi:hypothetical protein